MPTYTAKLGPSIDKFNASMARQDEARSKQEADFAARLALERQRGGMKTGNEAIQAYYAAQQPSAAPAAPAPMAPMAATPPPVASAPAVLPAPAPGANANAPGASLATAAAPSPSGAAAAPPFQNPAAMEALRAQLRTQNAGTPDAQGFGMDVAPLPPAAAGAPPAAAPVPAAAPSSPISGFSVQPKRPGGLSDRPGFKAMMDKLTSNPDTANAAMTLFNADRTEQTGLRKEGMATERQAMTNFVAAAGKNDLGLMREINRKYQLGIPEQFFASREGPAALAAGINTIKGIGVKDDVMALTGGMAYLENLGKGMKPNDALQDAFKKAKESYTPKLGGHYIDEGNNVQGFGTRMENVNAPGKPLPKARPPREPLGPGGGSSATERIAQRISDEADAAGRPISWAEAVAQAKRQSQSSLSERDKVTMAERRFAADQRNNFGNKRRYESVEDARAEIDAEIAGRDPAAQGTSDAAAGKPKPTKADRDYAKAHPEAKAKFLKHFGVNP